MSPVLTYPLDSFCLSSWHSKAQRVTVAQTVYKTTSSPQKKQKSRQMQPFKIFKGCLPFERPKDASPKMMMRVQLLGFIATNSSAMTEHRYAVYVGMSNDYIPQGSLCAVLSKIAVCRPVYSGSAHSESPTEPQCSMSSNTGR